MERSRFLTIIGLMVLAAVIIAVMAIWIGLNFSHLEFSHGIILAVVGVIGLVIIASVVIIFSRSITSDKKNANKKKQG